MIKNNSSESTAYGFLNGFKAGTPIAIGYIPSAAAFGILAQTAGFTLFEATFMSAIVFAGASQFVAVNLLMIGASFPEIVLAVWVLNLRLVMMSAAIAKRFLFGIPPLKKIWMCFELTDESFSVAAMRPEKYLSSEFEMGLNLPGHCTWTLGTVLGWLGTSFIPISVQDSVGIAIYALFIGLLIPSVRKNRAGLVIAVLSMVLASFMKWTPFLAENINKGIAVMLTAGLSAAFGAVFFPLKKAKSNE